MPDKEIKPSSRQARRDNEPEVIDLTVREELIFSEISEMTVKCEAAEVRRARLDGEDEDRRHRHRLDVWRFKLASAVLVGFLLLSAYLLICRPGTTGIQWAGTLVGDAVSGCAAYAFGNRTGKAD